MPYFSPSKINNFTKFRQNPKNQNLNNKLPCIVKSFDNFCLQGRFKEAINSLHVLSKHGIRLNSYTIAFLLQQCAVTKSLKEGKCVHLHLKLTGLKRPPRFVSNHLINMYFRCGKNVDAFKVFDKMSDKNSHSWNNMLSGYAKLGMIKPMIKLFDQMPEKDVVSWNTVVIGYAQNGFLNEGLKVYKEFRRLGIGFNSFSFAGVLTICVKLKDLRLTKQVHCQVFVLGFLPNVILSSSIVDAYAKSGEMSEARKLFDSMVVKDVLAWTTLVSGYAKWGDMKSAGELFDQMPEKNSISWTALISGYARNGQGDKTLQLFAKMMVFCIQPDQFTFSSCLCACASIASLKHGKQIHSYLIRTNFSPNTIVVSSLIDMYSKCGNLKLGSYVFNHVGDKQDVVLWNTMISALSQHGLGEDAINMFNGMIKSGIKPDQISFVVILNACSHSGLVHEGIQLFNSMTVDHGINPNQEHYACLIDTLGRAGMFDMVITRLEEMPFKPDERIWNALLGVCRIHGNMELGKKAAEHLIELNPSSSAAYVLLSSIYAATGKWEWVEKVRRLMNERCVKKELAVSWVEGENKVHSFTVSDNLHPQKEEIYAILDHLSGQIEEDR